MQFCVFGINVVFKVCQKLGFKRVSAQNRVSFEEWCTGNLFILFSNNECVYFGWEVGKFTHFVNNLHIYTNQYRKAYALMNRTNRSTEPKLRLTCPKGTNFFF